MSHTIHYTIPYHSTEVGKLDNKLKIKHKKMKQKLTELMSTIDVMNITIKNLSDKIEELEYAPPSETGGSKYEEAKASFEKAKQ